MYKSARTLQGGRGEGEKEKGGKESERWNSLNRGRQTEVEREEKEGKEEQSALLNGNGLSH